jgi:small ligand-binding sensory domain FIST
VPYLPCAHVVDDSWEHACSQVADRLGTAAEGCDLGFLYVTDAFSNDLGRITEYLRSETGVAHWVGTQGVGICSTGVETYDRPAMVAMATDIPSDRFRLLPGGSEDLQGFLLATEEWRKQHDASFAIVHGDPRQAATPRLIAELADGLDGGFVVGGLTSSESDNTIQLADDLTEGGLSGVLLAGTVPVATGLTQGCSLIGAKHEITEAQHNIIATIDGRPALDVFREDIGETLSRDLNRVAGYIFAALPIRGSDTGDYLVRNLVGIDPDQGLIAVGDLVETGMGIQFAKRDANSAREDLVRMLHDLKARTGGSARGALYFSCLGRGRNLFGDESEELEIIREELGDVPLAGFYANGEISHRRLYGYTGVLTLLL